MTVFRKLVTAAVLAFALTACGEEGGSGAGNEIEEPFFEGETVDIYVGRGPGSGGDLAVRAFARYWQDHIPGNPTIVVRNMPGGGGTRVWNYGTEQANPDGYSVIFSPIAVIAGITEQPGFRADYNALQFIGGLSTPNLVYARTGVIPAPEAILTAEGFKFAGQSPSHRFDILGRLALDILEVDYEYVTGFGGAQEVFNAVRRDAVHAQTAALNLYEQSIVPTLVENGEAIPLWHNPTLDADGNLVPVGIVEGIPDFVTFYRTVKGEDPTGEAFEVYKWLLPKVNTISHAAFLPPDAPPEALEILRSSFIETSRDPRYREEAEAMSGFVPIIVGHEEGKRTIGDYKIVPDNVSIWLDRYITETE